MHTDTYTHIIFIMMISFHHSGSFEYIKAQAQHRFINGLAGLPDAWNFTEVSLHKILGRISSKTLCLAMLGLKLKLIVISKILLNSLIFSSSGNILSTHINQEESY